MPKTHRQPAGEGEATLGVDVLHALVFGMRVQSIFDRDVNGSVQVESVNFGGVTGEGG